MSKEDLKSLQKESQKRILNQENYWILKQGEGKNTSRCFQNTKEPKALFSPGDISRLNLGNFLLFSNFLFYGRINLLMKTLRQIIQEAEKNKVAIGHFNVSDLAGLKGIFKAALEISLSRRESPEGQFRNVEIPVIIGVSEGEAGFVGYRQAATLIKSLREEYNYPIFINADHTKSLEKIKEAVEAGFDAVMFDGSGLSFEENIKKTKEVVEYVKSISASRRTEILVEAELGYLKGSSTLLAETIIIKEEDLAKPEEASQFVKETGVDLLAPAVGNIHGILMRTNADLTRTYAENPMLDIERIKEIKKAVGIPLVLHGGSGIIDDDFLKAIDAGISIIHINTELRLAWREGMDKALKENPEEIAPYKLLPVVVEKIRKAAYNRLKLFNKL